MKKILVADVPQMDSRYSAALTGWDIEFARTMGQARRALAGARYDLVAIGVHFDDSQMFDLAALDDDAAGEGRCAPRPRASLGAEPSGAEPISFAARTSAGTP
jgi:hypothetical protein